MLNKNSDFYLPSIKKNIPHYNSKLYQKQKLVMLNKFHNVLKLSIF